ncbi:glutamine--fructose-6-phosphate transaminase (isomerizing) [Atopobacter sp. AH10]|uniref:glutamine--fructose-6-phosphate transaminase (isomerizing) n=1 Tax=Atopobacter sp. AH10 TaxID=2315861 RepID=UPI000EF1B61A|nr:glutamine--fructose-6-phosphate transaminase (isomerizing) [Atopobacter sp. AH10]RLK62909.1 glutamine--fructose-6-phosphate transaminase (isomerizing) [Atopobacter sp. AH10]
MCGIVGAIGNIAIAKYLLKGLQRLEYRGYDSAGIALMDKLGDIHVTKVAGKIANLIPLVDQSVEAVSGIGHTRWATHGPANTENAHPHLSASGRFAIVHNGVIDNYKELKERYLSDVEFLSDTDTEVVANLIDRFVSDNKEDELEGLRKALRLLEGSYALGIIDRKHPERLYAAKEKSPLLVGVADEGHIICSDAMAGISVTKAYLLIQDGDLAILTADDVRIENLSGEVVEREMQRFDEEDSDLDKGLYPYYMLKEIEEQPSVLRHITSLYQEGLEDLPQVLKELEKAETIYMVASGTSYHASCLAKRWFEQILNKRVEAHIASEFTYEMPVISQKPFFIFLSQSGETADSRHALVKVKAAGYPSLTITNVKGSTLAREASYSLPLLAGREVAVASTKAYIAQLAVMAYLVYALKGELPDLLKGLKQVEVAMERLLSQKEAIRDVVKENLLDTRNAFYIGRGLDYLTAMENALKLKEISYLQVESFAAGELKHGTIALIEDGTPVIAIVTQAHLAKQTRSNLEEVRARGGRSLTISSSDLALEGDTVVVDAVPMRLRPFLSVVVGQLIAYYTALEKGYNVDQPRNLAKSVTVE